MATAVEFRSFLKPEAQGIRSLGENFNGCVLTREMVHSNNRRNLSGYFKSLSDDITAYANKTKEMLPKSPVDLENAFYAGTSSIFFAQSEGGEIVPVGHASCVPLYTNDNVRVLEFGGWFVKKGYRTHRLNDQLTIGENVGRSAMEQAQLNCQQDNVKPIIIATVKRANALKGLVDHLGFKIDSFHRRPFTTTLTCVCSDTSEHFGCQACIDRRGPNNGELYVQSAEPSMRHQFTDLQTQNGTDVKKIPCTLLVHETSSIDEFEKAMMDAFQGAVYTGLIRKDLMIAHKKHLISLGEII